MLVCQEACSWFLQAVKALDFLGSAWSSKAGGKEGEKKEAELRSKMMEKAGPRGCHITLSAITQPAKSSNTRAARDSRKANFSLAAGKKTQLQGNLFFNSSIGIYLIS